MRLVLLSRLARSWQDALLVVKPETVLRWHCEGFRLFWRRKSRSKQRSPRIAKEVVHLIRPIFAFVIIELGSRKVVRVSVTRSPSQSWTAQQLSNATPWGAGPRFLIRDNDDK